MVQVPYYTCEDVISWNGLQLNNNPIISLPSVYSFWLSILQNKEFEILLQNNLYHIS